MNMQRRCVINLTNGSHRTAPCLPNRDSQLRIAAVRKREWRNLSVNGRLLWRMHVELPKSNSWSQSPSATSLPFWWLCVSDSCDQYPWHQQPPGWLCNAMRDSISSSVHGHSMIFLHIPTTPDHDSQETWCHAVLPQTANSWILTTWNYAFSIDHTLFCPTWNSSETRFLGLGCLESKDCGFSETF